MKRSRLEKNRRSRARKREKKAREHEAAQAQFNACCVNHIVTWDCFCSFGCDCCDITHECSQCHRKFRLRELTRFKEQAPR